MCNCRFRCMWIWVWILKGASKTPTRQKKSPNCADDAPERGARATYGSIINTIGRTFLPSYGLVPAKINEKQCKMYYSHGLAWVMHSEPFAC